MSNTGGHGGDAPMNVKEVGTTTVACPMLSPTNYTIWALRMKVVLRIHKVWTTTDLGTEDNDEKKYLVMGLLYQAIPESLIMQIGDVDTSKALWESIKALYVGADRGKEARLQTLNSEFDRLTMSEKESIDTFAGKLSGITSTSASMGETSEELKMVKKLLKSILRNFFSHCGVAQPGPRFEDSGVRGCRQVVESLRGKGEGGGRRRRRFEGVV